MADNSPQNGTDTYASDEVATLNGSASSGIKVQRVKAGWGANDTYVDPSLTDPLPVQIQGIPYASTSGTVAAGATGTIGPASVPTAGNVSFIVKNTVAASPWAGTPVLVFEQSDDNTSWAPMQVVNNATGAVASTHTLAANTANASVILEAALESVNYVRVRVTTGPTTNGMTVVIAFGSLPFNPLTSVTDRKDAARTSVMLYAANATAAATTVAALITLAPVRGAGTVASTSSFALTAGKTLRIVGIRVGHVGHATATSATSTFHLRLNTAGTVTTSTTPILMQARVQTPASSNAAATYEVPLGDGYEIPVPAGGNYQLGITATSVYTTNAPSLDVHIVGYEF